MPWQWRAGDERQLLVNDDDPGLRSRVDVLEGHRWFEQIRRPAPDRPGPRGTFIKVDLPAPFSPQIAWISPRRDEHVDVAAALTPGNSLVMFRISRMTCPAGTLLPLAEAATGVPPVEELLRGELIPKSACAQDEHARLALRNGHDLSVQLLAPRRPLSARSGRVPRRLASSVTRARSTGPEGQRPPSRAGRPRAARWAPPRRRGRHTCRPGPRPDVDDVDHRRRAR